MSKVIEDVQAAVADVQAAQSEQGTVIVGLSTNVANAASEIHRLADRIGGGAGPTELLEIKAKLVSVASGLRSNSTALSDAGAGLQAVVDEPDPDAVPVPNPVPVPDPVPPVDPPADPPVDPVPPVEPTE